MYRIATILLAGALCAGMGFSQTKTRAVSAKTATANNAEDLTKIENDWTAAGKAKDANKLGEILADDWRGLTWEGKTVDKAKALAQLKDKGSSLDTFEMGPMDVRFFGSTAVVTGSDTEKSKEAGKDTSGKYVWTDVFVKQNGKWRVVASQSAKVSK
jgi:ketosteroid isomerase-like protein